MIELPQPAQQEQQARQMIGQLRIQTASQILCATLAGIQRSREANESETAWKGDEETPEKVLHEARTAAGRAVLCADCLMEALGFVKMESNVNVAGEN